MGILDNATLIFRSGWGLPFVALAFVLATGFAWYWNRPARNVVRPRVYYLITFLEALAVVLLVLYLVNPRLRYLKSGKGESSIAIAVDATQSMSNPDAPGGLTRYEQARRLLIAPESPLRDKLREKGHLTDFTFTSGIKEQRSGPDFPDKPDPSGLATDLAGALRGLAAEVKSKKIQSAVLATDGADTVNGDLRKAARELKIPLYIIGVGKKSSPTDPWKNAGIANIDVSTRVNLKQEVEAKIRVKQDGFAGRATQINLLQGKKVVDTKEVVFADAPQQDVRLKFTPETKGVQTYTVMLVPLEGDRVKLDDTLDFTVMVSQESLKVLYVEGTLRWMFKFIRRVIEHEDTMSLESVTRTGGAKLLVQSESDIKYSGALPADLNDLAKFNVLLLGDFPKEVLGMPQQALIDKFVKEKKGGLLVLGGAQMLHSGAFKNSALEALLPVKLSPARSSLAPTPGSYAIEITPQGKVCPALNGMETLLSKIRLGGVYETDTVKPGAEVLLKAVGGGREYPLLVTQRFGEGRVLFLTSEELWKPSLKEAGDPAKSPTARFWIQAIRFLGQRDESDDKEDPLLMGCTDKSWYNKALPVKVRSKLRKPAKGAAFGSVSAEVKLSGQVIGSFKLPEADSVGRAEIDYTPPYDGYYELALSTKQEGKDGSVICKFAVGNPMKELDRSDLDEALLRELARETGGGYFTPLNAEDIPQAIERTALANNQIMEKDLTDSPLLFLAFFVLVSGTWLLRRIKNLI